MLVSIDCAVEVSWGIYPHFQSFLRDFSPFSKDFGRISPQLTSVNSFNWTFFIDYFPILDNWMVDLGIFPHFCRIFEEISNILLIISQFGKIFQGFFPIFLGFLRDFPHFEQLLRDFPHSCRISNILSIISSLIDQLIVIFINSWGIFPHFGGFLRDFSPFDKIF